ncbi:MAG: transcription antitermination factor NusB [Pseudomonadota bacterium]
MSDPNDTAHMAKGKPKKDRGLTFRARTTARLGAVQVLYQLMMNPDRQVEAAVREFLEQPPPVDPDAEQDATLVPPATELLSKIVRGVQASSDDLDGMIDGAVTAPWNAERIEPLLRCLLRAGAYELLNHSQFDSSLLIKEYMTVTDGFFSEKEPKLVNAVMDRLAKQLRG